ncbi:MAG: HTH domain-containing protein, partial [Muribaculaceae bacterium]|nr:HTH domain-containing protein [Muribaculaceae bacterium]
YIKQEYDITPGRILKLLDILYCGQPKYSTERNIRAENEKLRRYLRKINDLRIHCNKEMTESEIYDLSFDMAFDFIDLLYLSKATLSLSLMIMYWIQRECKLLPLPLICKDKEEFKDRLEPKSDDLLSKRNAKKEFRLFMRKLLDLHLRSFIKNATKDNAIKPSSRDRILELVKNNPAHTAKTMATIMELSVQAIQKQIRKLKDEGRLERIGPDRGGKWKVIDK